MPAPLSYFLPSLPEGLEGLVDLALDLRWSWNHAADKLWRRISPDLWDRTGNPWLILQTISVESLQALAADDDFRNLINTLLFEHHQALTTPAWFQKYYSENPFTIAYFSMEYGLSEALPIYSGGLGILAGDYLKTASDLGVPVIGVGLLYQQGYFRQVLDSQGNQTEYYPYNDPSQLPIIPVRDRDGEWLRMRIGFPGRIVWLRCWEAKIGRVKLYLLDSNDPANEPQDRIITSELYGGGSELRLQQEIVLGIGGWRLLSALGIQPEICHLNEGHAALVVIERARHFMMKTHQPFQVGLAATRPGNIFTTHTPVEAGFDRFPLDLVSLYLSNYAEEIGLNIRELIDLGRQNAGDSSEPLNMAFLATRGSGVVNAVSRLHSEVSRRIFQPLYPRWPRYEVPVVYVTNGVHMPSWDSETSDTYWTKICGKGRWLSTMDSITEEFKKVSDELLWDLRMNQARQLIHFAQERIRHQLLSTGAPLELINECGQSLDPNVFTIGFARRFTDYKRPNLLLDNIERLDKIVRDSQKPIQIIIAGKAHPRDEEGKKLVEQWWQYAIRSEVRGKVVFLSDYDLGMAGQLVQGVDLWVNTPRRPWEACGTSGMKTLVNGGLNLSELDGWWAEAYRSEVGWAIGDRREHDRDPNWDRREAEQLYRLLEENIIPCFYERDNKGIPRRWVARMRDSMSGLTPQFSANRMVREYVDRLYSPAVKNYRRRFADQAKEAILLCKWQTSLRENWDKLNFVNLDVQKLKEDYIMTITVHNRGLDVKEIQVQLYADPENGEDPEIHPMQIVETGVKKENEYLYRAQFPAHRPAEHYTPRILPHFDGATLPLEANNILWYER